MTESTFAFPDGRRLTWREAGAGPPLVLLHGWSSSGRAFAELTELLSASFRVLIPDLPGHGDSSPAQESSLNGLADDLQAWLKGVEERPLLLGGWSLGGMLSLELAERQTLALAGLVLIGTTPRFTAAPDWPHGLPSGQVRVLQRNLGRGFENTLGDFFRLTFSGEEISPERLRAIRHFAIYGGRLPDPEVAAELLQLLSVQDQREALSAIDLPVLVIHGKQDAVTLPGAAAVLTEQLPQARLEWFDNAGHAPFWGHPARVAACFKECLAWFR